MKSIEGQKGGSTGCGVNTSTHSNHWKSDLSGIF